MSSPEFAVLSADTAGPKVSEHYSLSDDPFFLNLPMAAIEDYSARLRSQIGAEEARFDSVCADAFDALGVELPSFGGQDQYFQYHRRRLLEIDAIVSAIIQEKGFESPRLIDIGFSVNTFILQRLFPLATVEMWDRPGTPFPASLAVNARHIDLAGDDLSLAKTGRPADIMILAEVIEHLLINPIRLLSFLFQCLSNTGSLIITTPNFFKRDNLARAAERENPQPIYPDSYKSSDAPHFHVREYAMKELLRFVHESGGRVEAFFFSSCWDTDAVASAVPDHELSNLVVVATRQTRP